MPGLFARQGQCRDRPAVVLAILELRMELHKVTDGELKALCDMMSEEQQSPPPPATLTKRLPPYLKLVK